MARSAVSAATGILLLCWALALLLFGENTGVVRRLNVDKSVDQHGEEGSRHGKLRHSSKQSKAKSVNKGEDGKQSWEKDDVESKLAKNDDDESKKAKLGNLCHLRHHGALAKHLLSHICQDDKNRAASFGEESPKQKEKDEAIGLVIVATYLLLWAIPLLHLVIVIVFAVCYNSWVVREVGVLQQRPMNTLTDFTQGLCSCWGNFHMCLHTVCCLPCRAAHTWNGAQLCEFWPSIFLQCMAGMTGAPCCVHLCIFTYYRMKLKEKLGIQPNMVLDCLVSCCCPCCSIAQEAMAIDEELGVAVECCCKVVPTGVSASDALIPNASTSDANDDKLTPGE
jgi:Cys-rich protein (TIGR01571 family)